MRYLLFVLSVLVSMALPAQDVLPQDLFGKCFNFVNEKSGKEKFKGQILKGKRNGMGYILYKNGDFYAGDFYRNDYYSSGDTLFRTFELLSFPDAIPDTVIWSLHGSWQCKELC